ncbi:MAG: AMP-binding protein [Planctomycetota bacterium]
MKSPIQTAAKHFAEFVAFDDGQSQITYGELVASLQDHVVGHLPDHDAGRHVAWCPANDYDGFLTFWSLLAQQLVACPISHRFPESVRDEVVRKIDAAWLPALIENCDHMGTLQSDARREWNDIDLHRPATIILSSGSTGTPKAIVHSLAAHIASAEGSAKNIALQPSDRWLWNLPLCHVSGLSILIRCAVSGATVVGIPSGEKLSARLLSEQGVTHLSLVTTQLRRLLEAESFPPRCLKSILVGGSSADPKLIDAARERGVNVHTTYGLTETASQVTTSLATDPSSTSGRILCGRKLQINSDGEILVGGDTLCSGYYRDGEIRTIVDEKGWFHTGDLGSLDDLGRLSVLGRADNMFVSGGENIHPENIERAMLNLFELRQVVVVPKPDTAFGARPVAFVEGELPEDWRTPLRNLLSGYEIPAETRELPSEAKLSIKPERKMLESLAANL